MLFGGVLRNPLVRKAIAAGEDGAARAAARLLASDAATAGLRGLLGAGAAARALVAAGARRAWAAADLPSAGEVRRLLERIDELEALVDHLAGPVAPSGAAPRGPAAPPAPAPPVSGAARGA